MGRMGAAATGVAILSVLMWLLIIWLMIQNIDVDKDIWSRWVAVMTAVQAVAFAAAGALFGVKVQEQQTEKAEKKAKEGKELAVMVLHDMPSAANTHHDFWNDRSAGNQIMAKARAMLET